MLNSLTKSALYFKVNKYDGLHKFIFLKEVKTVPEARTGLISEK